MTLGSCSEGYNGSAADLDNVAIRVLEVGVQRLVAVLSHVQNLSPELPYFLDCGGVIFPINGEPEML